MSIVRSFRARGGEGGGWIDPMKPPLKPGIRLDRPVSDEADHFEVCLICGQAFDRREGRCFTTPNPDTSLSQGG